MAFNAVNVTIVATKIVGANTDRKSLIIQNASTGNCYIGPDDTVTSTTAVYLVKDGELSEDSGGMRMYMGDIYGIAGTGTCDIRYWERV